eukprot:SAG25_NODE_893_length_4885_cov_4.133723_1_plen_407_part_10
MRRCDATAALFNSSCCSAEAAVLQSIQQHSALPSLPQPSSPAGAAAAMCLPGGAGERARRTSWRRRKASKQCAGAAAPPPRDCLCSSRGPQGTPARITATITMKVAVLASLASTVAAHSNLIYPKPRNAIDSLLPQWSGGTFLLSLFPSSFFFCLAMTPHPSHAGKAPYVWKGGPAPYHPPCVCKNGTQPCESAQTCLWMSVGCSIGCKECDGGAQGGTNPSSKDRCKSGAKATINKENHRTINREAEAGSDADWSKFNPWRAPGTARAYKSFFAWQSLCDRLAGTCVIHTARALLQRSGTPADAPAAAFRRPGDTASLPTRSTRSLAIWARSYPSFHLELCGRPALSWRRCGACAPTTWATILAPVAGPLGGSARAATRRSDRLVPSQGGGYQYRVCHAPTSPIGS